MAHSRLDPLGALSLRFDLLGALSLRFDPFETCLLWFDLLGGVSFAVRSLFQRRVFCDAVHWGHPLLRCDPFGALSLRFNLFGAMSSLVRSVWGVVFCDPIRLGQCLLWFDHLEAFLFGGIVCAV
jgi:hypothetical protein